MKILTARLQSVQKLNKRKENGEAMDIDDLIFQDGYEVVISEK